MLVAYEAEVGDLTLQQLNLAVEPLAIRHQRLLAVLASFSSFDLLHLLRQALAPVLGILEGTENLLLQLLLHLSRRLMQLLLVLLKLGLKVRELIACGQVVARDDVLYLPLDCGGGVGPRSSALTSIYITSCMDCKSLLNERREPVLQLHEALRELSISVLVLDVQLQ